jgi:excisionase family DNA binding protein
MFSDAVNDCYSYICNHLKLNDSETTMATTTRESLITTTRVREQAAALFDSSRDNRRASSHVALQADGRSMPLELANLLGRVLRAVASGRTVTIGTLPEELTTSVAASMLGISRPTLMKHISEKRIPAHKVGSHTRIRTADVLAFSRARLERQREAFDSLRALEDELDLA